MNAHEAHLALAPLIAGTQGWNDEATRLYTSELTTLDNPDILADACRDVLFTWRSTRRPTLADITHAYHARTTRKHIDEQAHACATCDGTRWVEAQGFHASYCQRPLTCNCHAVSPCPVCAGGDPGPGNIRRRPTPAGPVISVKQHLANLERRAPHDPEAADDLAIWRKHGHSPYVRALQEPA